VDGGLEAAGKPVLDVGEDAKFAHCSLLLR